LPDTDVLFPVKNILFPDGDVLFLEKKENILDKNYFRKVQEMSWNNPIWQVLTGFAALKTQIYFF
jgi:hypothetical protein